MKNLNREININKKVILVLVLVCVLALVFYSSYALFQISVIKDNVVVIKTGNIEIETTINDGSKTSTISGLQTTDLTINSGESRNVTFNLSTSADGEIAYKMFYKLINGTGPFYITSTTNFEDGILTQKMNKATSFTLRIENKGSDTLKIAVGVKGGLADSEILLSNGNMAVILNKDLPLSKLTKVLKDNAIDTTLPDDFTGGLVAINKNGELAKSNDINEYRYSGQEVDNYIKFNNELWRIVGIFKDENTDGLVSEYVKIVRDEVLSNDSLPENYVIDDVNYKLKGTTSAYWNRFEEEEEFVGNTDFVKSSIGNYLNTEQDKGQIPTLGYLNSIDIKSKIMLCKTTYYLGDVSNLSTNAFNLYKAERNVTSNEIYSTNVGLLYPSDLVYSLNIANWELKVSDLEESQIKTSWLYNAYMKSMPWLITKNVDNKVFYLNSTGAITSGVVNEHQSTILPVLTLDDNTLVNGGEGTKTNPYILF